MKFSDKLYDGVIDLWLEAVDKPFVKEMAEGILDEGCSLSDTEICIDIIDQFIEADKNNFVTKVMIKINRE